MEITIRKFSSHKEMKEDEYRYWQSVPASERIAAAWELSIDQYRMKDIQPYGPGLRRIAVRSKRTQGALCRGRRLRNRVYAQPRATKDLDIFIDKSSENAKAVYAALAEYGAPLADITPQDFENPRSILRLGVPPLAVDILQTIDGVDSIQFGLLVRNIQLTALPPATSQPTT